MALFLFHVIFETKSHCEGQSGLELVTLLSVPLEWWDFKQFPSGQPDSFELYAFWPALTAAA